MTSTGTVYVRQAGAEFFSAEDNGVEIIYTANVQSGGAMFRDQLARRMFRQWARDNEITPVFVDTMQATRK